MKLKKKFKMSLCTLCESFSKLQWGRGEWGLYLQMNAVFSRLLRSVCHNFTQLVELSVPNKK